MSSILVGTSSWSDPGLVESGLFYPSEIKTPAERLRYFADHFAVTEIDSSYHFFPTRSNLDLWLGNTPDDFVFNLRSFSLFTGHPTHPRSIPVSMRDECSRCADNHGNIYLHHLSDTIVDKLWLAFRNTAEYIQAVGKLGVIFFQLPPWFIPSAENFRYIAEFRERLPGFKLAVEFRTSRWVEGKTLATTLRILRKHDLALVCVDEPQGLDSSVPPISEVTSSTAIVRFHGRNKANWEKKGITAEDRFKYRYTRAELGEWAGKVKIMTRQAKEIHVIFKNKYRDYPVQNAMEFLDLLNR